MTAKKELGLNTTLMRDAEQHLDYKEFDELLDLAADVCLKHPLKVEEKNYEPTSEERLLHHLGIRGLSNALDIVAQPSKYRFMRTSNEDGEDLVTASSTLRWPRRHNSYVNPDIQNKIEAFGDALLGEAYVSLGTDVKTKIAEFKSANTDEEQIEILQWLDRRVKQLDKTAGTKIDNRDGDDYFYHPIRLSPRALGQYPHNAFDPTCLGKSILTASFVYQTDAPTLHGGVMATHFETAFEDAENALWALAERDDLGLSNLAKERLLYKLDELAEWPNRGFHAASLVQLKSGAWYALDPNYGASHTLSGVDSLKVSRAYDDIYCLGPGVRGIERSVVLGPEDMMELPLAIATILHNTEPYDFDAAQVDTILLESDAEQLVDRIREYVRMILATKDAIGLSDTAFTMDKIVEALQNYTVQYYSSAYEMTLVDEAIENAIASFFLMEESPAFIAERSRYDTAYRQRKVEDIRTLAYVTCINIVLRYLEQPLPDTEEYYGTLELGATNYRVGAAVLSDFATYCGDDLSYSFWASHWSSVIPITERLGDMGNIDHERFVKTNNANWLRHALSYTHQDGIIREFLYRKEEE